MATPTDDREPTVATLADTLDKRAPLLESLADGPRDQRDLRDALEVSRSTVYKSLKEVEEAGLVTECPAGYALTEFGRLAWQRHDDYRARLRRLRASRPLLDAIPDRRQLPPSLFEEGRVAVPGRHAPERPLTRLEELSPTANRLRVASPAGMPRYFTDIHDRVTADDQRVTMVLEPDGLARLSADYDDFEAAVETPELDLRVVEDELPFAITVFDADELGLFAYDDGVLVGSVYADDEASLRWGERVFAEIRDRSEPV